MPKRIGKRPIVVVSVLHSWLDRFLLLRCVACEKLRDLNQLHLLCPCGEF